MFGLSTFSKSNLSYLFLSSGKNLGCLYFFEKAGFSFSNPSCVRYPNLVSTGIPNEFNTALAGAYPFSSTWPNKVEKRSFSKKPLAAPTLPASLPTPKKSVYSSALLLNPGTLPYIPAILSVERLLCLLVLERLLCLLVLEPHEHLLH